MRQKLTDRLAKTLPAGLYWDTDRDAPRGFGLRVTAALARVWFLNYRRRSDDRERRITIGDVATYTVEEARRRAAVLRQIVNEGGDPLGDKEAQRAAPTVAELVERFEKEATQGRAPSTQAEYKAMARDWILPAIGKLKVATVERDDIERLHSKITAAGKARRANAVKSLLSVLFTQAIIWKMRDTNPGKHIKGNREQGRERFLSGEELDRLLEVLESYRENRPDSVDAITLAALTGSRRGEILSMRWCDLNLGGGVWTKPAEVTKQRRVHRLTLSAEAVQMLQRRQPKSDATDKVQPEPAATDKVVQLRRTAARRAASGGDDFVFRGGGSKTHCNALERDWREIRAAAGLQDCRFHDLRHSVASWLIAAGMSLPVVGSVLGHSKPATTARYAHLADEAQREATAIVGRKVGGKGSTPK